MLTGQAEIDFEKWHKRTHNHEVEYFKLYIDSMQYGVLVDWFDSVGIYVDVRHNEVSRKFYYTISTKPMRDDIWCKPELPRPEARTQAIIKANEIYNEK